MRLWLMQLVCAAFLCAIISAMAGEGPGTGLRRLLAQAFLILTLLSPLRQFRMPEIDTDSIRQTAENVAADGAIQAAAARNAIITDQLEAYILSKAEAQGLELNVRVQLDESGLPQQITLTGAWSPAEREKLRDIIARDLGVGEEDQIWNLSYKSGA